MDKLISKLKNRASYKQPYRGITITDAEADEIIKALEQEQEIKQQCMNAFAAGIMRSDEDVTGKTLPELFDEFWKLNAPELI